MYDSQSQPYGENGSGCGTDEDNAEPANDPIDITMKTTQMKRKEVKRQISYPPMKRERLIEELHQQQPEEMPNKQYDLLYTLVAPLVAGKDELQSFFDSMGAATRRLPAHLQLRIKRGLSTLVYDAEEEHEQYKSKISYAVVMEPDQLTEEVETS